MLILKLLILVSGIAMYVKGECQTKLLGYPYKEFKYAMGIPIGILGCVLLHSWWPLLCVLTYFGACEIGYGINNPLTKIVGQTAAVVIHGTVLGLALYPILGWVCILSGMVSGLSFYVIRVADDAGKIKEPWVGILRSLSALILIMVA